LSNGYYDYNLIRKQILAAQQGGKCSFTIHPADKKQKTKIKDDWSAVCEVAPCLKGWCNIELDIKIIGGRTRSVTIFYFVKHSTAYVWLFGTIFEELKKSNIIKVGGSDKIASIDKYFEKGQPVCIITSR
jgi:hypothetical protein